MRRPGWQILARGGSADRWRFARHLGRWLLLGAVSLAPAVRSASAGQVELTLTDGQSGEPLAARIRLLGPTGRPILPGRHVSWQNHFVADGRVRLQMPTGINRFTIERGFEYRSVEGHFEVQRRSEDSKQIQLNRFVDLPAEGWWSADLDVRRPVSDLPVLLVAEDLHVAWVPEGMPSDDMEQRQSGGLVPVGTIRGFDPSIATDASGSLLVTAPEGRLDYQRLSAAAGDPITFAQAARQQGAHICVAEPYHWDLPTLVALGLVDSVAVIHRHMNTEAQPAGIDGYPADRIKYPPPRGLGRWSLDIYLALLECGLRIPPVAGSGSGLTANAVGQNRVYVYLGPSFDYSRWWQGLAGGNVMITNGPLLRPTVEGQPPGTVFRGAEGESLVLQPALNLSTRFPVEYLEVLQDGQVTHQVRLDELASRQGQLAPVEFERSGWLAFRAVATEPDGYQYALSGPYYVEVGSERRISRQAAEFFLDWVYERARQIVRQETGPQVAERLRPHRQARDFWQNLVHNANSK